MAGKVIEILSTKKLFIFFVFLLLMQVAFFLIGGLIAPQPSVAHEHIMWNCLSQRDASPDQVIAAKNCDQIHDLHGKYVEAVDPGELVLITTLPRPPFSMTPWFQYLLGLLQVKLTFKSDNQYVPDASMHLDVHILYSNEDDSEVRNEPAAWNTLARCDEKRILKCEFPDIDDDDKEGYEYDCELLHLFQLGSIPHKYYLINLRLPVDTDEDGQVFNRFGNTKEMSVIAIRQNGGFTKVWMSLKTVLTVLMVFPLVWFWRRIKLLERKPMLIEKAIFSLGISMLFLNLPLEFISIFFEAPWLLFFTDLRQGFFYGVLLSFWIIFTGEHLVDQVHRNKLSSYRFQLGAIFTAMLALLAFDIAERGAQLVNPCTTIWTHHDVAIALIIVAGIAGCLYFLLLLYMVIKVFRAISYKKRFALRPGSADRFKNIVFRFRLLMLLSILTAALTIVFYILSQKYDGLLDFGEHHIEVNSAFFTGVYGLWNIYVFLVLSVYAPSHKQFDVDEPDDLDSRQELIELRTSIREQSQVTEQAQILQLTQQKERED